MRGLEDIQYVISGIEWLARRSDRQARPQDHNVGASLGIQAQIKHPGCTASGGSSLPSCAEVSMMK